MNSIINYFIGKCEYECTQSDTAEVLNALMENGIQFFNQKVMGENVRFSIRRGQKSKALPYLKKCNRVNEEGFFKVMNGCLSRMGLVFGAVFCLFSIFASGLFLWDIEVLNGDEDEVLALLDSAGLKRGMFIPSLEEEIIEIKALLNTDKYSYISINVNGTLAQIETEKRVKGEIPKDSTTPSNLVASSDGKIVRFEVHSGEGLCSVGQTVEKGQLLISGIDETKHHGNKVVRARGAVYAVVDKEFTVSYPFSVYEKVYTGNKSASVMISVCGVNLETKAPPAYELYDEVKNRRKLTFFNNVTVPIYITSTENREYQYVERTLTEKQAEYQARLLYHERLAQEVKDCEVLSRKVTYHQTENEFSITCRLSVITDIAEEVEIQVQ